jgi:hypothetical protein
MSNPTIILPVEPAAASVNWTEIALTAAVLAIACGVAWYRNRPSFIAADYRTWPRSAFTSLFFGISLLVMFLADSLTNEVAGEPPLIFQALALAVVTLPLFLLMALIDLAARRLGAARVRLWLLVWLILFAPVFTFLLFMLPNWIAYGNLRSALGWDLLEIMALFDSVGLIWWSLLPGRQDIAGVFD